MSNNSIVLPFPPVPAVSLEETRSPRIGDFRACELNAYAQYLRLSGMGKSHGSRYTYKGVPKNGN